MSIKTRITELLGIRYPIFQAGMSWASSSSLLAGTVSKAGGLGVIAAGPMRPEDLRSAIREVREITDAPFAVNVALYNKRAAEHLQIVLDEGVPVLIASQGSPREHIARFKSAGVKWLHVVAHPDHARKAEAAGVDGLIVVGGEAGGHPPPSGTSTLVLVRMIARAVGIPVVAGGGVADGAGVAAMLCLGADAVQMGTRFLLTPEASLHDAYKEKVLAAGVGDTTLVGWRGLPIRAVRNAFTAEYEAAEQAGQPREALEALFGSRSLKMAALDGDVEQGKVEAGQCAALIDELVPAATLVERIMAETCEAVGHIAKQQGYRHG
ncbi:MULTISPECIES: NAD(P)H-dependent flavin oxidoreductase [unclassified Cupriavidus]|uniref:NAD(P)H-dependent flavin oxidoreductase n=1 Tax=unclassified Cupriavidus TaxID=2640874 RepID=UPI00088DA25F|nr:nitronate monooxygenase [Cupriavidus sp. YR651]SDC97439.1 enoyl-[acyl-carrier protein] reductase II [Cupriavidus sp. YR651]